MTPIKSITYTFGRGFALPECVERGIPVFILILFFSLICAFARAEEPALCNFRLTDPTAANPINGPAMDLTLTDSLAAAVLVEKSDTNGAQFMPGGNPLVGPNPAPLPKQA